MSRMSPTQMTCPHLPAWMPRTPPDCSGMHGLAIEGQGGERNMGLGIKSTLSTLTGMRITELIAPCGDTAPLFPGTPSKCFSCFSLYFYDVMNIFTQRSRALRSVCCARGCMGPQLGHYPKVPQSVYMFHTYIVVYISTNTHIVKHRIFPHKFIAISVQHGKAFLTETYNSMRVQCTVASEAIPGRACLPGPAGDSVLRNDHTRCTSFPPKHSCTQTWSSTQNMFTKLLAYW